MALHSAAKAGSRWILFYLSSTLVHMSKQGTKTDGRPFRRRAGGLAKYHSAAVLSMLVQGKRLHSLMIWRGQSSTRGRVIQLGRDRHAMVRVHSFVPMTFTSEQPASIASRTG